MVVDLWKVVGERKVLAIVDVESPDMLDQIMFDLPIMQKNGPIRSGPGEIPAPL